MINDEDDAIDAGIATPPPSCGMCPFYLCRVNALNDTWSQFSIFPTSCTTCRCIGASAIVWRCS